MDANLVNSTAAFIRVLIFNLVKQGALDTARAIVAEVRGACDVGTAQINDAARKGEPSIVCPTCLRRSYNPNDIRERYCGACHAFHDDLLAASKRTNA